MSERNVVIVDKYYSFDSEEQKFKVMIEVFIPSIDEEIEEMYRNKSVTFFGESLTRYWGSRSVVMQGYRKKSLTFYGSDLKELENETTDKIVDEIGKLREVVRENEYSNSLLPSSERLRFIV